MSSLSSSFELKISDLVPIQPHLKLELSSQALFIVLYIVKFIYLVKIEKKYHGFKLKLGVHIICFLFNFFNFFANLFLFISKTSVEQWFGYVHFVVLIMYMIVLASALLLFLHWVSMITDVFSVTKGGKILTRNNGILFFGVFFVPNLILSIFFYIVAIKYREKVNFDLLMKVQQYFLLASVCLVTFILWGFLVYQLNVMNTLNRNSAKKFFAMAFLFSLTTVLIPTLEIVIEFSPISDMRWCMVLSVVSMILFHFQILFSVFPISLYRIKKHYNLQFSDHSNPKNSNIPLRNAEELNSTSTSISVCSNI
ncbi:hypothetical protein CYY_000787 [Polysphondylium violaceum]|uniref:Uncharacterized protein n=1 Tax=Polysphondylium violaceum TaxID=133409 RepID=A0A8J4VB76_9MYCE|nr:hypothetical protein CYY_000787 [Polysphondylium violaceum]